jgi:Helix-turn-helix domain of transposase family ISL3
VRATTLLNRLLDLPGLDVSGVSLDGRRMLVEVRLRARRLACPLCPFRTWARYDIRPVPSSWQHLDFGTATVVVFAYLRRVDCPEHGVLVEAVPFARYRSGFTRDFEDVTAFLATKTDKSTIARFLRIDWDTVGRICARVVATDLDADRLDGLVNIGVDRSPGESTTSTSPCSPTTLGARWCGARQAKTPPPSTRSSTNWAPTGPPRSRPSRWTWDRPTPKASAPRATPPRP